MKVIKLVHKTYQLSYSLKLVTQKIMYSIKNVTLHDVHRLD